MNRDPSRIRGLYGLADAGASGGDPVRLGTQMLEGGCRLVQLRCKDWSHADTLAAARELGGLCRAVGALFIVNDHPDIAVAVEADGVHVGQTDLSGEEVRRLLGPHRLLGRSTNDLDQLVPAMAHADYVAFGPVFDTPNLSRPKDVRGVDRLARAAQIVAGRMPLVAIGGITAERLPAVRAAGADAWAVIGAIASAEDVAGTVRTLLGD